MTDLPIEGEAFNVGSFISEAIDSGLSMRRAREQFRAAGMRMSNESFAQLYSEIRDTIGGREVLQGIDYNAIPDADIYGTWAMGEGGRFSTFVTSYVRRIGERNVEQRFYTYTTDQPHSPQEAIDIARDQLTNQDLAADSFGGGIYQGSVVTSMVRTRPA